MRIGQLSKWIPVLVIEDEELVRKALKRGLQLYGFRIYLAEDGPAGLRLAQDKKPAFILLDWMMPGMDGLQVLAELKHNEQTEHIPVFMLTGRGMIGDLDQAFEIGADGYITKPADLGDLGRIVKAKWQKYEQVATAG
jgi:two-component system phosphate regulon response regulator PhoB